MHAKRNYVIIGKQYSRAEKYKGGRRFLARFTKPDVPTSSLIAFFRIFTYIEGRTENLYSNCTTIGSYFRKCALVSLSSLLVLLLLQPDRGQVLAASEKNAEFLVTHIFYTSRCPSSSCF